MSQQRIATNSNAGFQNNNFGLTASYPSVIPGKLELASDQPVVYPGSSFYVSPMTANQSSPSNHSYYYDNQYQQHQFSSDSSLMSSSPPPQQSGKINTCSPSSIMIHDPPMLVASSSSTTTASTMSSSSVEFLNEAFAKASSLPDSFYPEFLQYSKETYEQSTGGGSNRKKQRRNNTGPSEINCNDSNENGSIQHFQQQQQNEGSNAGDDSENDDDMSNNGSNLTSSEIRRQIHIQSEQKRRAQIKDGFEELRSELPTCLNKKMSKVALLHRTVQHIQHLKDTQMSILSELERLVHENEQLRKFQESMLQKQALENMYTMTNM